MLLKTMKKSRLNNFTIVAGTFLVKHRVLYILLNHTWGLLTTLPGYILFLFLWPFAKVTRYRGNLYLEFKKNKNPGWGFSLGAVIFSSKNVGAYLLNHERGHTFQNAIFGPFMLFLVTIPSFIRYWYRRIRSERFHISPKNFYYEIWFEHSASVIGSVLF